ncbi:hypothetical protein GPECTOR_31g311 [Gonium pectorale]|uniref:Uncharacterized protein n=1 Tax=Gonium pectorale TaxID=33097 RepID=A0A150GDN8_GONPE|nr:hypothetical protein GPECTOR_31g311 [Gonium pectorale]|eukprot:KXZ47949.1 hypothetical protein GPECTOR_31g311 [Gonium pectorale]
MQAAEDCPDGLCPGEVNGTLNTCSLTAPSCVSVMSDDEAHFVPPWTYDVSDTYSRTASSASAAGEAARARAADPREAAVERLLDVATGGYYEPGLSTDPYVTNGYSRFDAAAYLLQRALNSATGAPPPARPQPQLDSRGFRAFDGQVVDRHTTADGSIYLRIRFGGGGGGVVGAAGPGSPEGGGGGSGGGGGGLTEQPRLVGAGSAPLDAEFLFPAGDSIVTLRCAEAPSASGGSPSEAAASGRLALSFERGLEWETNDARRRMELLRKALRWDVVPVISEFDPKFNNDKPLWFERLYEPFRTTNTGSSSNSALDDLP